MAPKTNIKMMRPININTVPAVLAYYRIKKPIVIKSMEAAKMKVPN